MLIADIKQTIGGNLHIHLEEVAMEGHVISIYDEFDNNVDIDLDKIEEVSKCLLSQAPQSAHQSKIDENSSMDDIQNAIEARQDARSKLLECAENLSTEIHQLYNLQINKIKKGEDDTQRD